MRGTCVYTKRNRTYVGQLIRQGKVKAKKEGDFPNARVLVDLDTVDAYRDSLPVAEGHKLYEPKKRRELEPS
jgi:hypothetical protein